MQALGVLLWVLAFGTLLAGAGMAAEVAPFSLPWLGDVGLGFAGYLLLSRAAIRAMHPDPDVLWRAADDLAIALRLYKADR